MKRFYTPLFALFAMVMVVAPVFASEPDKTSKEGEGTKTEKVPVKKEPTAKKAPAPLSFSYGGLMYVQGRYEATTSTTAFASMFVRQYLTASWDTVSAVVKLEMDPTFGSDATGAKESTYFGFGADRMNVIEVKNAYLSIGAFDMMTLKAGILGHISPGKLLFFDDAAGMQLDMKVDKAAIYVNWFKEKEGDTTVTNNDDKNFFSAGANIGMGDMKLGVAAMVRYNIVGANASDLIAGGEVALTVAPKDAPFSLFVAGAAAGGTKAGGGSYFGYAADMNATFTIGEMAKVSVFATLLSGDTNTGDTTVNNWSTGVSPNYLVFTTPFFYFGEYPYHAKGIGNYKTTGAITAGAKGSVTVDNLFAELLAAVHLPSVETTTDYGVEVDLTMKYTLAQRANILGRACVYIPFATGSDVQYILSLGPSVTW